VFTSLARFEAARGLLLRIAREPATLLYGTTVALKAWLEAHTGR
jgi:hypothetical protein